jgi:hypothetical protein
VCVQALLLGSCCVPLDSSVLGDLWTESPVLQVGAGNTIVSLLLADGTARMAEMGYQHGTMPSVKWKRLVAPAPYSRIVSLKCGFFHLAMLAV